MGNNNYYFSLQMTENPIKLCIETFLTEYQICQRRHCNNDISLGYPAWQGQFNSMNF